MIFIHPFYLHSHNVVANVYIHAVFWFIFKIKRRRPEYMNNFMTCFLFIIWLGKCIHYSLMLTNQFLKFNTIFHSISRHKIWCFSEVFLNHKHWCCERNSTSFIISMWNSFSSYRPDHCCYFVVKKFSILYSCQFASLLSTIQQYSPCHTVDLQKLFLLLKETLYLVSTISSFAVPGSQHSTSNLRLHIWDHTIFFFLY